MKRVLVTGASGFIGRHALPELVNRGFEVHAVSRSPGANQPQNVHWRRCDILDDAAQAHLIQDVRPSHLLHFAWCATPGVFWTAPENLDWVAASLRLYRRFLEQGGERMVFAGTCAEYDWSQDILSETKTPLAPSTLYGTAKNSLRSLIESASEQTNASWAWGRIFFLYGPHEDPARLAPSVIANLLNGREANCSHGRQIRDFMHVEDVARAFVSILESDFSGAVNIASGNPVAIRDVVNQIARKIGRPDLVKLGAIPTASNDPPRLLASNDILSDTIGFQPKYDLDTGLNETIDWWRLDAFPRLTES
ncbi:MAG: NAD-dependent epimerase/dehydratase family protein [Rhodospirillaceae bacterium]|jgi:nucleoside-diphosphate-sugar epimerase|nr:NAD-dependent epimerase/dehydratase family protein [Rhodospirillaceae bacterium]MBT5665095.1 NAD-dependent epimerase/dehydratase family protein [Rhodospirillaceae bacterium]